MYIHTRTHTHTDVTKYSQKDCGCCVTYDDPKVKNKLLFSLAIFHDNVNQQNSSVKFHVPNNNQYKTAIQLPRLHSQADLWERNKAAAPAVS